MLSASLFISPLAGISALAAEGDTEPKEGGSAKALDPTQDKDIPAVGTEGEEGYKPAVPAYADTEIPVWGFTEDALVYSVDVEWGAMTFCYENSTWDATAHQSVTGGGWKVYDSEKGEALSSAEDAINQIQVTNHSNAGIRAQFDYTRQPGYDSITGSFRKAPDDLDTKYDTVTRTLTLATADNQKGADGAGKATVGTLYFMPLGRKQELENGITRWTKLGTITVGIKPDESNPQQYTGK